MKSLQRIMTTTAPAWVILIRLVVGGVFLSEGIQKFLFPSDGPTTFDEIYTEAIELLDDAAFIFD